MKNHHRGINSYTIEISLCLTGQNSLSQHAPWIQSDPLHDSAVIAHSEYSNQDINYLMGITRCHIIKKEF